MTVFSKVILLFVGWRLLLLFAQSFALFVGLEYT